MPVASTATAAMVHAARASALPARRILVVDDHHDTVDSHAAILEVLGQQVARAYDGASAVRLAGEFLPDIVLLDLDMPGMTGFQVARALRDMPQLKHTRVIAHSGFGRAEYQAATDSSAFDSYVSKPLPFVDLVRLITDD